MSKKTEQTAWIWQKSQTRLLNGMIPDIQYLASLGKRMECQSKAQNERPLKHILSIRIFDIFLKREEFHFLYFSPCIYVRHTLKESSFLATNGLLFLIKRHWKCSKYYCWAVTNLTIKISNHFQMLIILKSSFSVWCTAILFHFLLKLATLWLAI